MTPYEMEGVVELVLRCTSPLPLSRIVLSIALVLIVMPIVAVGIVVDGITYDANMSVTYSPANPIVNEQMMMNIAIKNTGTTSTDYILRWNALETDTFTYQFPLYQGYVKTIQVPFVPRKSGTITFTYMLYLSKPPDNPIIQNLTETIVVYSRSQTPTIIVPTPSVSSPTLTQSLPPTSTLPSTPIPSTIPSTTTPEVSGFECAIAIVTLVAIIAMRKIKI